MNWAWATSLDQLWRSPAFPMWLTLAAAGFFAIIVLITLLRAEKSVANGALTVITLLASASPSPPRSVDSALVAAARLAEPQRRCRRPMFCLPALVVRRRSGGRNRIGGVRKVVVRLCRIGRRGGVVCGVHDHAADRVG